MGANVTLMLQDWLGLSVTPEQESLVIEKSPGLKPVKVTLLMVTEFALLLVSVMDCAALGVPKS